MPTIGKEIVYYKLIRLNLIQVATRFLYIEQHQIIRNQEAQIMRSGFGNCSQNQQIRGFIKTYCQAQPKDKSTEQGVFFNDRRKKYSKDTINQIQLFQYKRFQIDALSIESFLPMN